MWSIDRMEGGFALCENTETEERCRIMLSELPPDLCEGDLLQETPDGWQRVPKKAEERRRALKRRLLALFGEG